MTAVLFSVVAVVIGGSRNTTGALIGAYLLGFIQNLSVLFVPVCWQNALIYIVLVLCLVFKPNGLFTVGIAKTRV